MNEASVITEIGSDGVARVTLDRPKKHNAFDAEMIIELRECFDGLARRDDVVAVVLGSQGKNFSAGADLRWMKRMAQYNYDDNHRDAQALAAMLKALYELPQPTIARVQGAAFGGAVGLVSCCDMAIAEEGASFCLSEVKIGLIPATISPYVIRALGERASRRYFTTAEKFSATTALDLGLVSEVVPAPSLDDAVSELLATLLNNGPLAIRAAKKLVVDFAGKEITPELVEDSCSRIAHIRVAQEGQEGLDAFLNKRQPDWTGE